MQQKFTNLAVGSSGCTSGSVSPHGSDIDCSDDIVSTIQNLEYQRKKIFDKAHIAIKKAQIHQAKGYNNRQAKGKPFEIGERVLKRNVRDQARNVGGLRRPFNGPYTSYRKKCFRLFFA